MKTLKLALSIVVIAFLTCTYGFGQKTVHTESVVTLTGIDFGPGIGVVWGTYTTKITVRLSKEGYIENIHVVYVDSDLRNTDGETARIVGGMNDNLGILWNFTNYPNASNAGFNIAYDLTDGWLTENMPPAEEWPTEGHFVMLSAKLMCNGYTHHFSGMMQIHLNAKGELTASVAKFW
jgi:hypothetical protein